MYCVSTKSIRAYEYDNEILMNAHEQEMINDGWQVTTKGQLCFSGGQSVENKLYREFTFHEIEDSFQ